MSDLWDGGTWQSVSSTSKGRVINQLLSCFRLFWSFQSVVLYVVSSLSLATEVMGIPASPGFWKILPMILGQGLQMTSTVAFDDSLTM